VTVHIYYKRESRPVLVINVTTASLLVQCSRWPIEAAVINIFFLRQCHLFFRRVRKIPKSDYQLVMSVCLSVCLSVCPSYRPYVNPFAWNNYASIKRIFMIYDMRVFLETLSRKFKFD